MIWVFSGNLDLHALFSQALTSFRSPVPFLRSRLAMEAFFRSFRVSFGAPCEAGRGGRSFQHGCRSHRLDVVRKGEQSHEDGSMAESLDTSNAANALLLQAGHIHPKQVSLGVAGRRKSRRLVAGFGMARARREDRKKRTAERHVDCSCY